MYIDTHTKDTIQESVCRIFNIEVRELEELFKRARTESHTGMITDGEKLDSVLNKFIDCRMSNENIGQILFFHIGRRLNSAEDCVEGKNLFELLSTKNAMSVFLKNHEVTFKPKDGHLDLYYKDKLISLEDTERQYVPYLRWRLGYNRNRIDYCFNGFMFRDLLLKNNYVRSLYYAPEFISSLALFLGHSTMKKDYLENSEYYCFEYLVPIDKVYFDNDETLQNTDKQKYLLNQVLHRLYNYYVTESRYMFDHDNAIIRLSDYDVMQEEYFVTKEKITLEMLT
ncbi:MAG: hypothetical protein ACLVIU_08455 [Paraclostridium sp.]